MDRNSLSSETEISLDSPVSTSVASSRTNMRSKKPYFRAKPRFNQPSAKVAYAEKPVPATLSTRVIKYYHPIYTVTSGIDSFSSFVYQTYAARDKRLENAFSQASLSYVSTLALTYKIYRLSNHLGYGMKKPSFYNELEEFSTNLVLPEPIAKYIEAVGTVPSPSGICLVPYAPTEAELASDPNFLDLQELLETEQPVQVGPLVDPDVAGAVPEAPRSKIFLSSLFVGNYMMGAAIGAKFGTLFRKVDWNMNEGKPSFVSAFSVDRTGKLVGYSPYEMEQVQCQLGACYRLRCADTREQWLGYNTDYRLVHVTDSFHESVFMIDTVMNHMMAR